MAVLEALKNYRGDEADFAPNVYIRPGKEQHEKHEELDLLWKNFKISDFTSTADKTPKFYIATGIVAGALLVGALMGTVFFANSLSNSDLASAEGGFSLVPSSETEDVAAKNETYIVQSGDTIEKILIRFYGQYSKVSESNLMQANNMTNPNKLSIGQQLVIPMN